MYESDGALWLRTSDWTTRTGDRRSDGEPTYFAADIAYHLDKLSAAPSRYRLLGADHHGYVPRMRAAIGALGQDPDNFEAPIIQMVHLRARRRADPDVEAEGDFVTLDELLDDIGTDATRFFMLQRSHDTDGRPRPRAGEDQSQDNPVYYVQYAHARIASILRKARAEGAAPAGRETALTRRP